MLEPRLGPWQSRMGPSLKRALGLSMQPGAHSKEHLRKRWRACTSRVGRWRAEKMPGGCRSWAGPLRPVRTRTECRRRSGPQPAAKLRAKYKLGAGPGRAAMARREYNWEPGEYNWERESRPELARTVRAAKAREAE